MKSISVAHSEFLPFLVAIWMMTPLTSYGSDEAVQPRFEVASIKPKRDTQVDDPQCRGFRFAAAFISVAEQVAWSYNLPHNRIVGMPGWASEFLSGYSIEARSAEPLTSFDQCRLMTRALLADRFGLKEHREKRTAKAYALVCADGGRKLAELARRGAQHARINGQELDATEQKGMTMTTLAQILGSHPGVGLPVVDKTGLMGHYVFDLTFFTREGETYDRPHAATAVREQLGLRLEPIQIPIEFLVIDHVQRPTEN